MRYFGNLFNISFAVKKRLTILSLTFCILFQTFGIQLGEYNIAASGASSFKKSAERNSQNSIKSNFLSFEENEESVEDDIDDKNDIGCFQGGYLHFSNIFSFLSTTFHSKANRYFLFSILTHKTHKFLIFGNLRI